MLDDRPLVHIERRERNPRAVALVEPRLEKLNMANFSGADISVESKSAAVVYAPLAAAALTASSANATAATPGCSATCTARDR